MFAVARTGFDRQYHEHAVRFQPLAGLGIERVNTLQPNIGVIQKNLTETTFRQYLDGFVGILPADLARAAGGRLRYAIDTIGSDGRANWRTRAV